MLAGSSSLCARTDRRRGSALVEIPCYTRAVYRAFGWIRGGTIQGRGRYDTKSRKATVAASRAIWRWSLRKNWKTMLNRQIQPAYRHDRTVTVASPLQLGP